MAAALSVRPGTLNPFMKYLSTSYNEIPSNPGGTHFLLFLIKNLRGCIFLIMRTGFIKAYLNDLFTGRVSQ